MSEMMEFPKTWEEYKRMYSFCDKEEVYTNGSELMQILRIEQWLEHIENKRKCKQQAIKASDCISRQDAIDELEKDREKLDHIIKGLSENDVRIDHYVAQHNQLDYDIDAIRNLPSALPCPEGFDPEHLTEQDKKDILEALDWVKGTITEEVPSAEPDVPDTNVGDIISRQDAIDKLRYMGYMDENNEVEEALMRLPSVQPKLSNNSPKLANKNGELINRQDAIDAIYEDADWCEAQGGDWQTERKERDLQILVVVPSAQPDRDIPRKPIEGCGLSWGKKVKEAGCPNCSFFLSHYRFYGEGKRITYCEHCGQAIDWEGWEWDANY